MTIIFEEEGVPVSDVEVPAYDPGVHAPDDEQLLLLEMWCECGMVHRQVDPVSHLLPQLADFRAKHTGKGHGATDAATALAEREARREAGHRATGLQDEYEPKERAVDGASAFDWTGLDRTGPRERTGDSSDA